MTNAAKALILLAAFVVIQPAGAADPLSRTSRPAGPEPDTTPAAQDGARLFSAHCAMCHQAAELARPLQAAIDPAAVKLEMAAFLARHGRSDAAADEAIIDYLLRGTFQ